MSNCEHVFDVTLMLRKRGLTSPSRLSACALVRVPPGFTVMEQHPPRLPNDPHAYDHRTAGAWGVGNTKIPTVNEFLAQQKVGTRTGAKVLSGTESRCT